MWRHPSSRLCKHWMLRSPRPCLHLWLSRSSERDHGDWVMVVVRGLMETKEACLRTPTTLQLANINPEGKESAACNLEVDGCQQLLSRRLFVITPSSKKKPTNALNVFCVALRSSRNKAESMTQWAWLRLRLGESTRSIVTLTWSVTSAKKLLLSLFD